jgi:hypothetical protein
VVAARKLKWLEDGFAESKILSFLEYRQTSEDIFMIFEKLGSTV